MIEKYHATINVDVAIETDSWSNAGHAFDDLLARIEALALDGETITAEIADGVRRRRP